MTMTTTTPTPHSPPHLSPEARRLLDVLRDRGADAPERAITDGVLGQMIGCRSRDVILYAGELLHAGYLVLATCTGRHKGRFIGTPAQAERYANALRRRAAAIRARAAAVESAVAAAHRAAQAVAAADRRRPPDTLFDGMLPRPRADRLAAFTR